MKVKRTFLSGCEWCGGTGVVFNPFEPVDLPEETKEMKCPVCRGERTILIKEEYENDRILRIDVFGKTPEIDISAPLPKEDYRLKRKLLGLSLREVAAFTGISPATISRIERGKESLTSNNTILHKFYFKHNKHGENE